MATTAAPGMALPDLSWTFPEKLPVAWLCMVGTRDSISTQKMTTERILGNPRNLENVLSVRPVTDPVHFVPTLVHFIVKPFLHKAAIASIEVSGLLNCKNWMP